MAFEAGGLWGENVGRNVFVQKRVVVNRLASALVKSFVTRRFPIEKLFAHSLSCQKSVIFLFFFMFLLYIILYANLFFVFKFYFTIIAQLPTFIILKI